MNRKLSITILLQAIMLLVYGQGSWQQIASVDTFGRAGAVGFSIGDKGYLASGGGKNDLWEYDPLLGIWTQKASFGFEGRLYAVGFSIGSYGYVGTGDGSGQLHDFWRYDPATNAWMQKANFAGGARRWATGMSIGDKGYIGMGTNSNGLGERKDWWEYDPITNTWTEKAKLPGERRNSAFGFSIGPKGYVGAVNTEGPNEGDFWEYDPATDIWTQIASYPGHGRIGLTGFVIADRAYVGTGIDSSDVLLNDFWKYDAASDSWVEILDFPGPARYHAVGFSIGGKGYIGTGDINLPGGDVTNDFWEFTPHCEVPTGLTTSNIKATNARLNWNAAALAQKYSVRYRKTGTMPWSKTTATTNFKKLAGLTPNTQYDWSVKSVCDAVNNVSSDWSATQNFTTNPLKSENGSEDEISLEVYPNPFSNEVTLSFFLAENAHATVELFDVTGRRIKSVLDQMMEAGDHQLAVQRGGLPAGVYFLLMKISDHTQAIPLIIE